MSKCKSKSVTNFALEGQFLGFAAKESYKLKYLRLATATGEYTIKIDKELRSTLWRSLIPGEWVQVLGYQKQSDKYEPQLKAYQVNAAISQNRLIHNELAHNELTYSRLAEVASFPPIQPVANNKPVNEEPKAKILVCQKSDCCRRGGIAIAKALQDGLRDRHMSDQVTIQGTGCMKRCKAGPNIVMPDKTRYSGIAPDAIPALIDKHLGDRKE